MMLKNEPEEEELKVIITDEDSELIERLKKIIEDPENKFIQTSH